MNACRCGPARFRACAACASVRSAATRSRRLLSSDADDIDSVIAELRSSRASERQGRLIDADETASMERKKREGYF